MKTITDQNKCDAIITYCWNRVGYNILRSLYLKGLNVWVADTSKYNICSLSRYSKGSFTYPDPFTDENAFINTLKAKVSELHPKILIPTHDESIIIMKHRNEFPSDLVIPYENSELLKRLSNKAEATSIATKVGVPIPMVYKTVSEIKSYPIVFKTVFGNSAKSVFFPKSAEGLSELQNKYANSEVLMQEYIGGGDFSVDCIRWDNYWQPSVYRALVTKTDGGGTTTQREIVEFPLLSEYARAILDEVDYHGVCGMDFRYDSINNKIAFIEINARFTGGIATPIAAGFDIPWILYDLSVNNQHPKAIDVKIGTKTKWILGDVITVVGRILKFKCTKSELMKIFSFKNYDAFDDFYNDDKFAILGEMGYYLGKLVKSGKLNP